ncbi:MAG: type IV secretory system conjugative DNA transfer family protein [Candidatus Dormibacteraeota bacterium]|nr:type IV secretory system conjugative DNA transfer family protein [Candidatus Dormibacteraeota bacterium]
MSRPVSAPPRSTRAELWFVLILAGLWLGSWSLLSAAAWLAGGHPSESPVGFVDPARIAARVRDGGFAPWDLVGAGPHTRTALFWPALFGLMLAVASVVTITAIRAAPRRGSRFAGPGRRLRSVSRWARGPDLHGLLSLRARDGRFILGAARRRLILTERETSVLVVGPTRSGKTTCLVVPNLLEWRGPAVVTSTKGELLALTAAHRQRRGPVFVYDPTGETAEQYASVSWSPLVGCEDLDRAWMVAAWLCAGLQQGTSRGDNDWAHWAESGKLLIAPLLFAAASTGLTVVDVHIWIHGFDLITPSGLLDEIVHDPDNPRADDASRALTMVASIDQRPERERGTVFSTVMRIFNVFNERAVAASAMTSRFEPRTFLERNGTLYLCTPRLAPERIASLFVGILMTVVTEAYAVAEASPHGRLRSDLGLFLDELANVVPIEDLPALASLGAGRGVLLLSIVQDLSQLRARYGPDRAHSILNNHPAKLILPGISDPETVDLLSRLVGRHAVTDVQVSRGGDGHVSRSYSIRNDNLATPDALRQLDAVTAVALYRGRPPILVRLRPWYRSRRYRSYAQQRFFRGAEFVSTRHRDGGPSRTR